MVSENFPRDPSFFINDFDKDVKGENMQLTSHFIHSIKVAVLCALTCVQKLHSTQLPDSREQLYGHEITEYVY